MKANELRIGNYVDYSVNRSYFQGMIRTINNSSCNITGIGQWSPLHTIKFKIIEPIPLTEEWLLKFGFEILNDCKVGYEYRLTSGHIITFLNDELYCYLDAMALDDIKHIHQLQNLYFALTGEELTMV